jgi:TPR repeat protein
MLAVLNVASAGPLEDAEAANAAGDHVAALSLLAAEAPQNAGRVQSILGRLFPPCRDRSAGYSNVVALFRADAERGNGRAQFNLGNAYFFGSGVPKDYQEAARWYRKAADQGEPGALHNLGYMYENGRGVPQDNVQAFFWLSRAASMLEAHGADGTSANGNAVARSLESLSGRLTPEERVAAQALVRARASSRSVPLSGRTGG